MKLALLKGNRFNPWHLQVFERLPDCTLTAFRADSEIQRHFNACTSAALHCAVEEIHFDTQAGPPWQRAWNRVRARYFGYQPRIAPFHTRLEGYDVIQTWELFTDWTAEALEARRRWGVPTSVMVWDNIPFNMEYAPERYAMKRRAAREADRFIVHTDRSARVLDIEEVDPRQVVRIGPGVDTERFAPGPRDRARFGLEEDSFVLLFVGWLLPRKGIDFLLLALRELLRDPQVSKRRPRLLVVGSGPGRDRVDALVDRLGLREAVTFAGAVPYGEMPAAFCAADVFVLPSIATPEWQEQFGMALLEAMACGVPAVSTYSGAIPEMVGDAATLCQPNDFVALYEAIKQLALDDAACADLGAQGRSRVLAHYTLERYAAALSDVYADLLQRGR